MPYYDFLWDDRTIEHLADHDVSLDEFEEVVGNPERTDTSRSSGRPCCYGYTSQGRYLFCVYERVDSMTVRPVTAYEVADTSW